MKRIITTTVLNRAGVLNRITGLFTKRNFNIESISVGHTETSDISRMTFVVHVEDDKAAEQVTKQLHKQIDVLKVHDITNQAAVARELALIKVTSPVAMRNEMYALIEPFRATIIDVSRDSVIIQATGTSEKIEAIIDLLKPYGVKEVTRTGTIALKRGTQKTSSSEKVTSIL
ncbi:MULTISPECIES: acetolactate synthase small subunit [Priestia]|jgi:acetolactate synthase-1/3 small subunit|uniref:Acetolactate synthase small subunit n=3 Tax=Priestia TaxID=2800373 RepID=A0A0H4KN59_9BACI|nr:MULTISPECIES: acetolactate synthase small subunit [Priestia]AKO94316.1 acetolactate synthase small subunit [Priestia filamentosa]KAB2495683.1 acetolactate synthase small subunit [Priestia endophytica]KYG36250.1 acetolactate synthase small subunit [Priestia endophytica]MBG9815189.1 acetolactate synthase [Priestia endophytica]MCM3539799.1 acetolactate synthase small subunit [Priestia endophytica]